MRWLIINRPWNFWQLRAFDLDRPEPERC